MDVTFLCVTVVCHYSVESLCPPLAGFSLLGTISLLSVIHLHVSHISPHVFFSVTNTPSSLLYPSALNAEK